MYGKILSAVNEHLNSEIAARYALGLAEACSAKLYTCFIAPKGISHEGVSAAEDAMKRIFLAAQERGVVVESISKTGDPVREIGRIVRQEKIDLVFASTRRKDITRRFYEGTVARSLLVSLPCSVALVRVVHAGRIRPSTILVPLKERVRHLRERAYFTAKMAEAFSAGIFLFHAAKPFTKFFHGELYLTPLQWEEKIPQGMKDFISLLTDAGIPPEGRLAPGSVEKGITIEAAARRHDLIIMGASERGMLSSILRGSPVETVLRET
ncbi:MAG: universal stress protein, partial [Nitrospirales bacterium]|nr:universal stress protein [Nitrospirales bacterium]